MTNPEVDRRRYRAGGKTRRAYLRTLALVSSAPLLTPPVAAQELSKTRVMVIPADVMAGAYYAEDAGFFNRAGLSVELMPAANGGAVVPAIVGGSADIGVTSPIFVASAVARGLPITIVAGAGLYSTKAPTTVMGVPQGVTVENGS